MPVPDNVSDAVAAQFLVNPCTAYGLLESSDVPKVGLAILNITIDTEQKVERAMLGHPLAKPLAQNYVFSPCLPKSGGVGFDVFQVECQ